MVWRKTNNQRKQLINLNKIKNCDPEMTDTEVESVI